MSWHSSSNVAIENFEFLICLEGMMSLSNSSEVRSENPFVVSLNAVVSDNRVMTTATGNTDELSGRIRRAVLASRRGFRLSDVEHVGDLWQWRGCANKGLVSRVHRSSGVSHGGALKLKEHGLSFFNHPPLT